MCTNLWSACIAVQTFPIIDNEQWTFRRCFAPIVHDWDQEPSSWLARSVSYFRFINWCWVMWDFNHDFRDGNNKSIVFIDFVGCIVTFAAFIGNLKIIKVRLKCSRKPWSYGNRLRSAGHLQQRLFCQKSKNWPLKCFCFFKLLSKIFLGEICFKWLLSRA